MREPAPLPPPTEIPTDLLTQVPTLATTEVLIAGAGPVGMLLALLLAKRKIPSVLVEPRSEIHPHSRAIGIHPPGLEALERAGVLPSFMELGVMVPGGSVYVDDHCQGHLGFDQNPGKWKYPLLLPQHRTETILEAACHAEPLVTLLRGWGVHTFEPNTRGFRVGCKNTDGTEMAVESRYLIGCDGKRSRVRELLGIHWKGHRYPDRYLLGDVRDDTDFGDRAIIFLTRQGLVESFPLQKGWRRWVVHLELEELPESFREQVKEQVSEPFKGPNNEQQRSWITTEQSHWHQLMQSMIAQRTGHQVDIHSFGVLGSFGIERGLAQTVYHGDAFLAGDAAHIVSPIGGQGMNLGWMDAVDLAETIAYLRQSHDPAKSAHAREAYQQAVLRRARKGIRRAWFNTIWGRQRIPKLVRKTLVRAILTEPFRRYFTRQFTMTNLH